MHPFRYHRAIDIPDAIAAVQDSSDGKFLAGGQTLLASLKLRLAQPECLVDLRRLQELRGISISRSALTIGAMTTHAEVAASEEVRQVLPALASLAGGIGDPMVRHVGTLGGSVANSDPAADYPAALLALDAVVVTSTRRLAAHAFFLGLFETALQPGELIKEVEFPLPRRAAYVKFKHPASRFALVGVFVADTASGPRVAVTGAGATVFRVEEMERALAERFAPESLEGIEVDSAPLNSDLQATADYRAHLVGVIARRAVAEAVV
ncbi:MAG TPA: xanthine dehydrogenase family protein subunit M [Ramlibacter sp.]|nr:xanthine dehydrogenase family protein subunit M [Ramlibacter sp.]